MRWTQFDCMYFLYPLGAVPKRKKGEKGYYPPDLALFGETRKNEKNKKVLSIFNQFSFRVTRRLKNFLPKFYSFHIPQYFLYSFSSIFLKSEIQYQIHTDVLFEECCQSYKKTELYKYSTKLKSPNSIGT